MNRRVFLTRIGGLGLMQVPLFLAARAGAQQPIIIKSANVHQIDNAIQLGHKKFAELVAERTKNQLQMQIFPASQLGTEQEILESVQMGSIRIYEGSTGGVGRFLPDLEAFSAPYVWKDVDHMVKTVRGPIGAALADRLLKSQGLRVLDFGWLWGARYLTTKSKPIQKPEDLRGLKVRVQPTAIYLETIRAMGGNPVPMDTKEVYLGLQTGAIDGQENTADSIYSGKLYEVQKYLMLTSHILQNQTVAINGKFYQDLSPAFQQVIREAAVEAGNFQNDLVVTQEKTKLDALKAKGMTIVQPDVNAFREATKDVWKKAGAKWEPGLYEKLQRFQAELK
jgi:TRAP-type transport system periplasmic protein